MDKRYQVFVSSTYKDLVEERKLVTQTLMEMDCIPAGMELFPAVDQEQFEFIKKIIDDSDYYLIMVAGKYGSISPDTGLSYTEMEYDYAISKKIKVVAIVHNDIDNLPKAKTETKPSVIKKLNNFRSKVCTGRLVKFWDNIDKIPGLVSVNLNRTIKTFPAIGWVRADKVASDGILSELNELRKENDRLKKISKDSNEFLKKIHNTLKNNTMKLPVKENEKETWETCKNHNVDLLMIFRRIAPYLIDEISESKLIGMMAFEINRVPNSTTVKYPISLNQFGEIIADFSAFELIEPSKKKHPIKDSNRYLSLSKLGREFNSYIRVLDMEINAEKNTNIE